MVPSVAKMSSLPESRKVAKPKSFSPRRAESHLARCSCSLMRPTPTPPQMRQPEVGREGDQIDAHKRYLRYAPATQPAPGRRRGEKEIFSFSDIFSMDNEAPPLLR